MGLNPRQSRYGRLLAAAGVAMALTVTSVAPTRAGAEESYRLGMSALEAGNLVDAMSQFTAALDAEPTHASAAFERGKLLLTIGEPRLAVADFTTTILSGGPQAPSYAWRGQAKAVLKDDPGAAADFGKALDLAPMDADILLMRATFFLQKGDVGQARADLVRAKSVAEPDQAARIQSFIDRL